MAEMVVVLVIVGLVAILAVRSFYRTLMGKGDAACGSCSDCPGCAAGPKKTPGK